MPTKVQIVKAVVFPVVMFWCEIWTVKKAKCWRINAFELWCWRRLLRVLWTVSRLNQSILKEVNREYSWKDWCWSWSSNTLVTWYEEMIHWKSPWCWEILKAEDSDRGWDVWNALPIQWTWTWANSGRWWGKVKPDMLQYMGLQRVRHNLATEHQQHALISQSKYIYWRESCKGNWGEMLRNISPYSLMSLLSKNKKVKQKLSSKINVNIILVKS